MLSPGLPLLLCLLHTPICSFLLKVPPPPGRFPASTDSFVPYTHIFRSHVLPWTISYSFMLNVPSPHLNCTQILVSSVDSSALECSVCIHWFYFPWPLFLLEWQTFQWLFLDNKPFTFPWLTELKWEVLTRGLSWSGKQMSAGISVSWRLNWTEHPKWLTLMTCGWSWLLVESSVGTINQSTQAWLPHVLFTAWQLGS